MKKICNVIYILLIAGAFFSCNQETQNATDKRAIESGWKSVYQNDEHGNRLAGNLDSLIAGIRNGYDLRVGWGVEAEREDTLIRIEHIAKPLFLTIIQEKDVSIVIDAHPLLQSYWQIEKQQFREGGHIWQCVLNTTGAFNAQVYNRSTGELINDWPQRHKMTWFLEYPGNPSRNNKPLFD